MTTNAAPELPGAVIPVLVAVLDLVALFVLFDASIAILQRLRGRARP